MLLPDACDINPFRRINIVGSDGVVALFALMPKMEFKYSEDRMGRAKRGQARLRRALQNGFFHHVDAVLGDAAGGIDDGAFSG